MLRRFLFLVCTVFLASPVCRAAIAPAVVERGKNATAFVRVNTGSGSAFCISEGGVFVTDEHVVAGARKITLVLNPGEANERVLSATVLRSDKKSDLAVLKAEGPGPFAPLPLGAAAELRETMEVAAFGYPFGSELNVGRQKYPNISVNTGTITALRKTNGQLQQIQLDSVLNPGNSGGPVINEQGEVIGIVESGIEGTGVNFATPVNRLRAFLSRPEIIFDPAPVSAGEGVQSRDFRIEVVPLDVPSANAQPFTVSLLLRGGAFGSGAVAHTFPAQRLSGNLFSVKVADVGALLKSDAKQPPMLGLNYLVTVKQGGAVVAERSGRIAVLRDANAAPLVPPIQAPALTGEKVVVALPATIDDLAVGGGGRYLVLLLKKLRKLAVFDVSAAKVRYVSLSADDAVFAASAEKLVVVLPTQNIIERYDLATLKRELTAAKPNEGTVRSVTMGSASAGPLMIVSFGGTADSHTSLFDLATLQKLDIRDGDGNGDRWGSSWADQTFQVRASADGTVFTGWFNGLSPSGLHVLQLNGDKVEQRYEHESVGYVLAGADGSRIYTSRGLFTPDLKPYPGDGLQRLSCVPTYSDAYFLGVGAAPKSGRGFDSFDSPIPLDVSVYSSVDKKLLLTLPRLEELTTTETNLTWARETMTLEKRLHFYPGANLLVTIPETKDSLILRRFSLVEALDKAGLDYLFVNSTPVPAVRKGQRYAYQIDVKSKRAVTFSLDSGPPGATLSPAGRLVWNVPKDYAGTEENIIVSIRDAAEQQIYHSFKVRVLP